MKKRKSIVILVITMIIIILSGLLVTVGIGSEHKGKASHIKLGLDLKGGVSITYQVVDDDFTAADFSDTVYKLTQRVASDYSTESDVYTQGDDKIVVDIPGETDLEAVKEELGKPGSLKFVTYDSVIDEETGEVTDTTEVTWLEGNDIKDAQGGSRSNQTTGAIEYVVSLTLTEEGATKFEEATTENLYGTIYIVYDDEIISAPTVNSTISGGMAEITGMGSYEEAEQLASSIRIGGLKVEIQEISSQVISAKLGVDAVSTSLLAGLIGIILVIIFMIIVYRIQGLAAGIALVFYTILVLLFLNAFDMTLTLPGIAGIILSIGMAVDANVIIYARVREEITKGKSVANAIKDGFKNATSAIIDGNITTFIAAVVLMIMGTGSVKGFGQTLAIGIVISMFSAMVVSRLLISVFFGMGAKNPKLYGSQKERKVINFVGRKTIYFAISIVFLIVGGVSMIINNVSGNDIFNYNVEFKGGTTTTVEFEDEYSIAEFNEVIKPVIIDIIGDSDVQGQKVDDSNKFIIKTKDIDTDKKDEFQSALIDQFGADETSFETQYISSSVSDEMKMDTVIALIVSLVLMLVYIWFRFKNIRTASSAIIALIYDALFIVAFYAVSRIGVGNTFIACLLTIIGYSINSTIVIFDRIRENLPKMSGATLKDIVNKSITQTLSRSIYTNITSFVMILALFIVGVESMKSFSLPLMVGILAGTYSSIFITGSLYYILNKKKYNKENNIK